MNIDQYKQQIVNHNFLHETNCLISRRRYRKRSDPSYPACYPTDEFYITDEFYRFWNWFHSTYKAKNFLLTLLTTLIAHFDYE